MRYSPRAALSAASLACAIAVGVASSPSLALDSNETATAMLAAVTGPLLAVDPQTLAKHASETADFSTPESQAPTQAASAQPADAASPATAQSAIPLADLVAANGMAADDVAAADGDNDQRCLATAIYFESHGEPLDGQLAVAQTIINRAHSGRFPESVCGVVRQPGQFSFLHGGGLPDAPSAKQAWHTAVAIAKIAREGLWKEVAPASLYFHARSVAPGWGKVRVASIGNHVFFR